MKRNDKHINKFLHDPLPDPEIPADDAWAGMDGMLDVASGAGANGPKLPTRVWQSIGKLKGLLIGTTAVVTVSAVVTLVVLNNKTADRQTAAARISAESGRPDGTAITTDPVTGSGATSSARENMDDEPLNTDSISGKTIASTDRSNATGDAVTADSVRKRSENKVGRGDDGSTRAAGYTTDRVKNSSRTGNAVSGATRENIVSNKASTGAKFEKSISEDIHKAQTQTSSHIRTRHAQAPVARRRDVHARRPAGDDYVKNAFANPPSRSGNTESGRHPAESTIRNQPDITSSVSHENAGTRPIGEKLLHSLEPLSGHFDGTGRDLSKYVQKPAINTAKPLQKTRKPFLEDVHFGPEWNLGRSIVSPAYMFTSTDSVKRPLRLAIPGVFVSKSWNRHSATFVFNPTHTYFGDKELVAQRLDTLWSSDSSYFVNRHNARFIKSFGMNFSLQYQYRAFSWSSLVGGVSYSRYSSALLFREVEYGAGGAMNEKHIAAKGLDTLQSYIRPQQWSIRAGILFHSPDVFNNRLQFAWMTIFPVSDLSRNGFKSVKTPNFQISLRFLIK